MIKSIEPSKARIIFFDLEFYVPIQNRKESGFNYNPAIEGNLLLGGSFYSSSPTKDLLPEKTFNQNKLKHFWLWQHNGEKHLLESIYKHLREIEAQIYRHFQGVVSPVVCGIGISNSDLPVLFHLFSKHEIDTPANLFEFQNLLRVIDLSQLSIGLFNKKDAFLYPKTKNEILSKCLRGKTMESGKNIWELYECGDLKKIEARVSEEISSTISCYKIIKKNFDLFKQLEAEHKKQLKNKAASK